MRIIGGAFKGKRIQFPSKKWPVRPTTDFAREALFNILDNKLDYELASTLDLFGGTGMHTLELASRGCRNITYVDRYKDSVAFMKTIIKEWNLPVTAVQADVFTFLKKSTGSWDYIFADPPYDMDGLDELVVLITQGEIMKPDGFFVLEHIVTKKFEHLKGFRFSRTYGQSVFSFFDKVA